MATSCTWHNQALQGGRRSDFNLSLQKPESNYSEQTLWPFLNAIRARLGVDSSHKKSRKDFKPFFLFNEIKGTERRTLFILMKLLQRAPRCVSKLYFEAMKVLLVCVFLISRTRLFLSITSIINLEQFSISNEVVSNCKIITFGDVSHETKPKKRRKLSRVRSTDWKSSLKRFLFKNQLNTTNTLKTTMFARFKL